MTPYAMIDREAKRPQQPQQRQQPATATPSQQQTSPLPPPPGSTPPGYKYTGSPEFQPPKGYDVTGAKIVEVPVTQFNPSKPLERTVVGKQTFIEYNLTPVPAPPSLGEQIAETNPVMIGAGIAESLTGRKLTPNQAQTIQRASRTIDSPALGSPTQLLGGMVARAFEAPAYAIAGLAGVKGLPQPPTVTGALVSSTVDSVTSGKPAASSEMQALEQKSSGYMIGTLMGDIALSYAISKIAEKAVKMAVPKTVRAKISSTAYHATQSVKQSDVGVAAAKASSWLKHTPPVEAVRGVSRSVSTWFAKRGVEGAMEAQLGWDVVEKPVVTGFQKAFPSDIVYTAGTYKTYPGFELWATVQEAPKYAGYPTLRPLSAAAYASLRRGMEQQIFGGSQFLPQQVPNVAKELSSWETFSSTAEAHRYAGYPVTQGPVSGVKLTSEPTAYDQIRKAIERGMFPRMGGLSSQQVPVFAKPAYSSTEQLKYAVDYGRQKPPSPQRLFEPVESGRTGVSVSAPFLSNAIPRKPAETWTREKEMYRQLDFAASKPTTRQTPVPAASQLPEQRQRIAPIVSSTLEAPQQVETVTETLLPPSPPPNVPPPSVRLLVPSAPNRFDLSGLGRRRRSVKSAWYRQFERRNPILGGRELLRAYAPQTAKRRQKQ